MFMHTHQCWDIGHESEEYNLKKFIEFAQRQADSLCSWMLRWMHERVCEEEGAQNVPNGTMAAASRRQQPRWQQLALGTTRSVRMSTIGQSARSS
ncbi:hypothetical protein T12_587 [Trichinella patagoniensis]|uniref:Uncharacterized protein n=1 Tax=Trichinella patagoniensis TaxID=990121 RepID=A0A0V0ZRN5_9BILA|nr:hypothetical protein T12_587 [Trichinella patagoniensis]